MLYTNMPLFILLGQTEWNIMLSIGLFVLGGVMSITAWLFKGRMQAYDKHLDECRSRAVVMGRMDERLIAVENQVKGIRSTVQWVGDCMISIGAKLDIPNLPDRPQ